MPLLFVHGVANRPGAEQQAERAQRDALFRTITFGRRDFAIFNPDWGSHAVSFTPEMPWLPNPTQIQPFAAGTEPAPGGRVKEIGLGQIAKLDGAQAVDLTVMAALDEAIASANATGQPQNAADPDVLQLAQIAATYLEPKLPLVGAGPRGIAELATLDDATFAQALSEELEAVPKPNLQAFGIGEKIKDAVSALAGWVGNGISDAALRLKRRTLSQGVAFFLGDIFVYLRQREVAGPTGTAERLFEPILVDLARAAKEQRAANEPLVVLGHSLGGVLLYDILTDAKCLERLAQDSPGFKIDALLTVGSQPGFFADLGLYPDKLKVGGKLKKPDAVSNWLNVYDFTDVFSFLCAPFFEGVEDFGYDTAIDLVQAHSAYFKRPSFYKRLEMRLKKLGYL